MTRAQYVIGIDGGVNTGFAVYDRNSRKLVEIKTYSFWEAIEALESWMDDCGISGIEVWIEDVEAHSPTFYRGAKGSAVQNRISQSVGRNKRDCQLLKEWLERKGVVFYSIPPTKQSMTKLNAETFKTYTGWNERTSQHGRDAAMLVFGR